MKQYIKGIITGLIIAAAIAAMPTLAANIDALLNPVRININGVDTYQWGEEMKLADGVTTPSSILYNGTTYLPMRNIGELMDKEIYWNGDTQTVSMTGKQTDVKVVAEKPDANGNMWTYYTFKDSEGWNYLGVKDKKRGYERIYLMASDSVRVTDNEIYFARKNEYHDHLYANGASLIKLSFNNTSDTQDGEILESFVTINSGDAVFDGDYLYFIGTRAGGSGGDYWVAYNCVTDTLVQTDAYLRTSFGDIKIVGSTENEAILEYTTYNMGIDGVYETKGEMIYNKITNEFHG